jgi:hypothetical protein
MADQIPNSMPAFFASLVLLVRYGASAGEFDGVLCEASGFFMPGASPSRLPVP